ncbi:MAG: serine/threonine-protein kinase [Sandaracinaceae bacterium]
MRAPIHTSGLPPGHPLGRFEIVREVASGGFGTVYEGVHKHTRRRVALKVLHAHIADDDANRERFLREVRAPARVEHDAMVEVYDADVDPRGLPWVAMEWLEGQTLRDAPATLGELLGYYDQLLDGLAAAHAAGVIHRDLKPENVFLERRPDGARRVRLLDFGLAREKGSKTVTKEGISLGTPRYMSPEQLMNARSAGPPSDVWAVGVMLYEAVGGRPPFDARVQNALVVQILTEDHKPLRAPTALATLVGDCLAKEPTERLPNATALRERLMVAHRALAPALLMTPVPLPDPTEHATRPARPQRDATASPTNVATVRESHPFGASPQAHVPRASPAAPARSRAWVIVLAAGLALLGLGALSAAAAYVLLGERDEASDAPPSGPAPGPLAPSYTPLPNVPEEAVAPMRPSIRHPEPVHPAPQVPSTEVAERPEPRPDAPNETDPDETDPDDDAPPPPPEGVSPLDPLRNLLPI